MHVSADRADVLLSLKIMGPRAIWFTRKRFGCISVLIWAVKIPAKGAISSKTDSPEPTRQSYLRLRRNLPNRSLSHTQQALGTAPRAELPTPMRGAYSMKPAATSCWLVSGWSVSPAFYLKWH